MVHLNCVVLSRSFWGKIHRRDLTVRLYYGIRSSTSIGTYRHRRSCSSGANDFHHCIVLCARIIAPWIDWLLLQIKFNHQRSSPPTSTSTLSPPQCSRSVCPPLLSRLTLPLLHVWLFFHAWFDIFWTQYCPSIYPVLFEWGPTLKVAEWHCWWLRMCQLLYICCVDSGMQSKQWEATDQWVQVRCSHRIGSYRSSRKWRRLKGEWAQWG